MSVATFVAASIGCGCGAMIRYALSTLRREHHLPWPTLVANLLGTLLLGAAAALVDSDSLSTSAAFVIGGGIAGGLTTFSTLAVDSVVMFKASRPTAIAYLAITGIGGIAAGAIGWALASHLVV